MELNYRILFFLLVMLMLSCTSPISEKNVEKSDQPMEPIKAVLEYESNAQLGEGAFWNYQTQEFYWIDIEGKKLHIYNPETKEAHFFDMPSRIGTVVPTEDQKAIVALEDGMYLLNTLTGDLELFSAVENNIPENRFNDGKCDPAGRLWVGSMGLTQEKGAANLYKIEADGAATKMIEKVTISNGIVWTKDEKTMYYIDTPTSQIKAFDFDKTSGQISNERVAVEVSKNIGFPDGMAIDENDQLWVGLWNGNAVAHFDPTSGKLISKIEVPAHNITACAFGGPNLDKLFITTASIDMTEEEQKLYPLAGSVFVANPGVKGMKSFFFKK